MQIDAIFEHKSVEVFLKRRQLLNQYKKAKQHILNGRMKTVSFKLREPHSAGVWQFKINKQYRAYVIFVDTKTIAVFSIDNHQK